MNATCRQHVGGVHTGERRSDRASVAVGVAGAGLGAASLGAVAQSAAHAAAQRLGLEIVHPLTDEPWGVRRLFVRDPNGKLHNILSHA